MNITENKLLIFSINYASDREQKINFLCFFNSEIIKSRLSIFTSSDVHKQNIKDLFIYLIFSKQIIRSVSSLKKISFNNLIEGAFLFGGQIFETI